MIISLKLAPECDSVWRMRVSSLTETQEQWEEPALCTDSAALHFQSIFYFLCKAVLWPEAFTAALWTASAVWFKFLQGAAKSIEFFKRKWKISEKGHNTSPNSAMIPNGKDQSRERRVGESVSSWHQALWFVVKYCHCKLNDCLAPLKLLLSLDLFYDILLHETNMSHIFSNRGKIQRHPKA